MNRISRKRWLNIREAGEYIGYSRDKIYRLIRQGLLPVSRATSDSYIRIDREDLDSLMLQNKIKPNEIVKERLECLKSRLK